MLNEGEFDEERNYVRRGSDAGGSHGGVRGDLEGTITDSMCGLKHSADKHEGKTADHRACVQKCIKEGGEYVFVAGDKLHKISNQKFAGLKVHACSPAR